MPAENSRIGLGWLPDLPDYRDFSFDEDKIADEHAARGAKKSIKGMLKKVGVDQPEKLSLPDKVNLVKWCSPIEDQSSIGSCTAQAGVGLLEYFERRAYGKHINASRLFLYKVSRNLMHLTGDTGAYLRTTMGSMVLFGVPPEEYWPYKISDFDVEPPSFCYAFAQNYQAIQYFRLDPPGTTREDLLKRIQTFVAFGIPVMFGFTVFSSYEQAADNQGKIPFPTRRDTVVGGHAVVVVGYDNGIPIENKNRGGEKTKGALLIRNSWGTGWGDAGYGWLPYEYVMRGLAIDWWSLLRSEWVDSGEFRME